jgi:hypothetical protein
MLSEHAFKVSHARPLQLQLQICDLFSNCLNGSVAGSIDSIELRLQLLRLSLQHLQPGSVRVTNAAQDVVQGARVVQLGDRSGGGRVPCSLLLLHRTQTGSPKRQTECGSKKRGKVCVCLKVAVEEGGCSRGGCCCTGAQPHSNDAA